MIDRKNTAGSSNPLGLAAAVFAVGAVAAAVLFAPMGASSPASATATYAVVAAGTGYSPVQYVNQAVEIAPQPETF